MFELFVGLILMIFILKGLLKIGFGIIRLLLSVATFILLFMFFGALFLPILVIVFVVMLFLKLIF